jgi:hypothetical protein
MIILQQFKMWLKYLFCSHNWRILKKEFRLKCSSGFFGKYNNNGIVQLKTCLKCKNERAYFIDTNNNIKKLNSPYIRQTIFKVFLKKELLK